MSKDHSYIVMRGTNSMQEGMWYDLVNLGCEVYGTHMRPSGESISIRVYPTDEFEIREDGAVAQVWRPEGEDGHK